MPPLGDAIQQALSSVGVTEERVSYWLGADSRGCGCSQRKEKLNALGSWAIRIIRGRTEKAREYLEQLLTEE